MKRKEGKSRRAVAGVVKGGRRPPRGAAGKVLQRVEGGGLAGLRESDACLRAALEAAGMGEWDLDLETQTIYRSARHGEIFGYPEPGREWSLESLIGHVIPEDRSVVTGSLAQAISTRGPWEFECRIVRADGARRWIWVKGTPVCDPEGKPRLFHGLIRDITDGKRVEEALRDSREKERARSSELERVLDAVPAAVWITQDPRGDYIAGNRLADEWLRIPPGSNASKSAPEGVRPETFRLFKDGVEISPEQMPAQVSAGGKELRNCEFDLVYPDGATRHVMGNSTPLFGDDGKPRGSVSVYIDVTDSKHIERELRRTRDYLEALFNYANAPIITWDPEFRITGFNKAFELLTGRKAEDVIGQSLDILFSREMRDGAFALLRRTQRGERWETVEIPILRLDGSIRTVLWNSATLYGEDERTVIATVAQGHDITERRQAEEEGELYLKSLEFLAESATGFLRRQTSPEVFEYIALKISERVADGFVVVVEYDMVERRRIIRGFGGDQSVLPLIFESLGEELIGLRLPFDSPIRSKMIPGTLVRIPGGIGELSADVLPEPLRRRAEEEFGLREVCAIPLTWEDDILGTVVILTRAMMSHRSVRMIEAFVSQASVALNRLRTDDALRQREHAYRTLMEDASDGIVLVDGGGVIIAANSRVCELSGYTKEELNRLPAGTLVYTDEIASLSEHLNAIARGESAIAEHRLRRKDGSHLFVETSGRRLGDGRYQAIVRDITDRKRAEREFAHAVQSEVFDRLIVSLRQVHHGEGLAMNLHRLALFGRNYQSLISDIVEGQTESPLPVDAYAHSRLEIAVKEYFTVWHLRLREIASLLRAVEADINREAGAGEEPVFAADILKQSDVLKIDLEKLLRAARGEANEDVISGRELGKRVVEHIQNIFRTIDTLILKVNAHYTSNVSEVIGTIVRSVQSSGSGTVLEITEESPDIRAIVSPADLAEVLSILLTNSVEALAEESSGEKRIVVHLGKRGTRVRIEVEDNGEGVKADIRGSLFSGSGTTKGPGRGSGLVYARERLRKYGATLTYDEEYEEGARFVVELALA